MAKVGRPSSYTPEIGSEICRLMSEEGKTLLNICSMPGMPARGMIYRWLDMHEEFRDKYARAREGLADYWAEQVIEITDNESRDLQPDGKGGFKSDNTAVNRDRLKVDTRKWLMCKLFPRRYGDKVTTELTGKDGGPIQTQAVDAPPQETREEWLERRAKEQAQRVH